jgi:hypothetical protein
MRPLAFGEWVELGGRWNLVVSRPHPFTPGPFIWRSGAICVIPEIVDPAEEERVQRAPLPPEPDGLPPAGGYVIVKART